MKPFDYILLLVCILSFVVSITRFIAYINHPLHHLVDYAGGKYIAVGLVTLLIFVWRVWG